MMKKLRCYTALIMLVMIFCTSNIIAQSNNKNEVPATVLAAFAAKYPNAAIKNWNVNNGEYIAKAKAGNRKYFATFDNKGAWIKTVSKFNWPGSLSPLVRKAFNKSKYSAWHIYEINLVDTPSGQFYQVMVDNTNPPIDAFHQDLQISDWLLEFKSNGELISERNITGRPLI
jgi:hypothetical protein